MPSRGKERRIKGRKAQDGGIVQGAAWAGARAGRKAAGARTGEDSLSYPHPLSRALQIKTPWHTAPFPAATVTAGELALLARLDWRTSSPTPCDFAGALIRLALPHAEADAAARATAGAVSDAAIEAASTGRAGATTALSRPSAIGAAAALIGLHGAGQGEAALAFHSMMDEV